MNALLRKLFFNVIMRFITYVLVGVNIHNQSNLPKEGPAILVANHNSHFDTMALISIMPMSLLSKIRPVAACDYFMCSRFMTWFSTKIVNIVPVSRRGGKRRLKDPLAECYRAIEQGSILIVFPEGTRGEPEKISEFKSGIAHLAKKYPQVPVIPIYMKRMGNVLPRGTWLLVPFICDIIVGNALPRYQNRQNYMSTFKRKMIELSA